MPERSLKGAEKAKRSLVKRLSGEPGFVGAGISAHTSGRYELVVMVTEARSPILTKVPREWAGFVVRTRIGGAPRKFRRERAVSS
jgi:hypothetical protein